MTDDTRLTPDEERALAALPREAPLPPGLEDRVVEAWRRNRPRRSSPAPWLARLAAGIVIFLAGAGTARFWTASPAVAPGDEYLLLLYGAATSAPDEEAARVAEYAAWARELGAAGQLVAAERLRDDATVVGEAGLAPAAPSEPSGFFLIRARSAADAAAIAGACPHVRHGGTVVVRPIG